MNVDPSIRKAAQRNYTIVLNGLTEVSQVRVAQLLGESASTLSEFKRDQLERLAAMLAACNLKVVSTTEESISNDEVWALRILAIKRMEEGRKEPDSGFGGLS